MQGMAAPITLADNQREPRLFNLELVAQLNPVAIPDFLAHRLRAIVAANTYPALTEEYKAGRLRIDTDLTLEQAEQQWADLGLTTDSSTFEVSAVLENLDQAATVAQTLQGNQTMEDMQAAIAALTAKVDAPSLSELAQQQRIADLEAQLADAKKSAPPVAVPIVPTPPLATKKGLDSDNAIAPVPIATKPMAISI